MTPLCQQMILNQDYNLTILIYKLQKLLDEPVMKSTKLCVINKKAIEVQSDETLLQAALRQGIEFPNLCRVGGCGSCKCRLIEGEVTELTETGYILSEDEINNRHILACQAKPKTNLKISVNLTQNISSKPISGTIVNKQQLTQDIVQIDVQLSQPLQYKAGQFANITLPEFPKLSRSYSLSSTPNESNTVSFTIRKVIGGKISTQLVEHSRIGDPLTIQGPGGDFWLRPGKEPVLLVANGSGLGAVYGLLKQAANSKQQRPITLLYGAKKQQDLYYLDELEQLAKTLPAFKFVPILSQPKSETVWQGSTGRVTNHLQQYAKDNGSAYLCGSPAMVDEVEAQLLKLGMNFDNIHADRFVEQNSPVETGFSGDKKFPPHQRSKATAWDYIKFMSFHLFGLASITAILLGGNNSVVGFLIIMAIFSIGDYFSGEDIQTPNYHHKKILDIALWLSLPMLILLVFSSLWSFLPGDLCHFGTGLSKLFNYDFVTAKASNGLGATISIFCLTGLMIGMIGTIPAHELTHRTWDPTSLSIGRCLLAFSFDTGFAIEHVYGHHRYVSTTIDPATAPRGRNVYHHIVASTIQGNISAWYIEAERLKRKKLPIFSKHNVFIKGHLMSLVLIVIAFMLGGLPAVIYFSGLALFGKSLLEVVNYMEHYGMVRLPDRPVQPRHSWNTNARITSWAMFNLNRHSHHHAQGEVPFEDLLPLPEAPMMISGYLSTLLLTLIPPLWHRVMIPKLLDWDKRYASKDELQLIKQANKNSGIKILMDTSTK